MTPFAQMLHVARKDLESRAGRIAKPPPAPLGRTKRRAVSRLASCA